MTERIERLIEHANSYYEYETEHGDAADNYTVITDDHVRSYYGIEHPFADETYFASPYTLPKTEEQDFDSFNETEWLKHDGVVQSWIYPGDPRKIYVTVFLGQSEVEFHISAMGLDIELTEKESEWIEKNTDWTVTHGALYQMYPDICAVAEYHIED